MRKINFLLFVAFLIFTLSLPAKPVRDQTIQFGNMKATYRGNGTLSAVPVMGTDIWDIRVTDAGVWYLDGQLTISPQQKFAKTPCDVKIREVFVDGVIKNLKISFPPGLTHAGFVQNIVINGNTRYLTIVGGDLGSPLGAGGALRVSGRLTNLNISGKVFQNTLSNKTEYWGGNVWADLLVDDQLQYTSIKGGNLYFMPEVGGRHGLIKTKDNMRTFIVSSQIVKDKATKEATCYGGVVNCDIISLLNGLKDMQIKGGCFYGGIVRSKFMRIFNVTGFKAASAYPISPELSGIYNAYFEIRDYNTTTLNYTNFFVRGISVKDGNIANSCFTCQGNLKEFKAASKNPNLGNIYNSEVRAGHCGALIDYAMPTITMNRTAFVSTNALLEIPIAISNLNASVSYLLYLPHRDRAWSSRLESEAGNAEGLGAITITGTETFNAVFKWDPAAEEFYFGNQSSLRLTNLCLRLMRQSIAPELCIDINPNITVNADSAGTHTLHYPTEYSYIPIKDYTKIEKGNLNALSCNTALSSVFMGGTIISDLKNPEHASYLGNLVSAKFKYGATDNLLLSREKTQVSPKTFDFSQNEVWTNGQRRDK